MGVKLKRGWYAFCLLFKTGLCSTISFESSRRELSIYVAEHRSTMKNNQNTYYPRFSFTPKPGIAFPKTGFHYTQRYRGLLFETSIPLVTFFSPIAYA